MKNQSGPKHRVALRDRYSSAIGAAVLLLLSFASQAQLPQPEKSPGLRTTRIIPDSTLYLPTGCGAATDSTFLNEHGFKKGDATKKAALFYDSCGHHEYLWDPALKAWHITDSGRSGGGGGSGFSVRMVSSANFASGNNCALPALNNDSLQIFWNDLGRFLLEGPEWQNIGGGGFQILVPGFNASVNSYSLTVYSNNVASPPGPVNLTSTSFSTSTHCPITADNGMSLQIFWNDAGRYLIPTTEWTPLSGGGFTVTIPGFDATTTNYSFYVFAQ